MSDDTPTQRIPQGENPVEELDEERKKSRTLLFVLIGVGAALLIAIIVLLIILFGGKGTPSAGPTSSNTPSATPTTSDSPTPSATPTPTPTPTVEPEPEPTQAPPPPPDNSPGFASFNATNSVNCQSPNPDVPVQPLPPQIKFSWSAKNAQSVWFVFGSEDAADAGAFQVPLSGDQDDVYDASDSFPFPCPSGEQKMTLTVVGNNGQHVNKTFTVRNNGYTGG